MPAAGGNDRQPPGALWLDVKSRAQVGTINFPARGAQARPKTPHRQDHFTSPFPAGMLPGVMAIDFQAC